MCSTMQRTSRSISAQRCTVKGRSAFHDPPLPLNHRRFTPSVSSSFKTNSLKYISRCTNHGAIPGQRDRHLNYEILFVLEANSVEHPNCSTSVQKCAWIYWPHMFTVWSMNSVFPVVTFVPLTCLPISTRKGNSDKSSTSRDVTWPFFLNCKWKCHNKFWIWFWNICIEPAAAVISFCSNLKSSCQFWRRVGNFLSFHQLHTLLRFNPIMSPASCSLQLCVPTCDSHIWGFQCHYLECESPVTHACCCRYRRSLYLCCCRNKTV